MDEWKLHLPSEENTFHSYRCGLVAGQQVALRKDLPVTNQLGELIATIPRGTVWRVLPGLRSDPVLWFQEPDGSRHTWDDEPEAVDEWFAVIEPSS